MQSSTRIFNQRIFNTTARYEIRTFWKKFNSEITLPTLCSYTFFSNLINYKRTAYKVDFLTTDVSICTEVLARIRTPWGGNLWRNAPSNTRLSVARTSLRGKPRESSRTLFRLSWKGPLVWLLRHVPGGAEHLEPAACALRGIPPLVQPLPFATCRRRPVREHILACLRHFSKKRLAPFPALLARYNSIEQRRTNVWFYYCDRFMTAENAAESRRGDEIPFDLPCKSESILSL